MYQTYLHTTFRPDDCHLMSDDILPWATVWKLSGFTVKSNMVGLQKAHLHQLYDQRNRKSETSISNGRNFVFQLANYYWSCVLHNISYFMSFIYLGFAKSKLQCCMYFYFLPTWNKLFMKLIFYKKTCQIYIFDFWRSLPPSVGMHVFNKPLASFIVLS